MEIGSKHIDARYLIQEKLGQGAFGAVFKARDLVADVDVALKIIPDEVGRDAEELADLKRNFQLVTKLNHPHIANYKNLEYFKATDKHILVMEYVDGVGLAQFRKSKPDRKIPIAEAVQICRQMAEALDFAHAQSILHRDIKPENIRIKANGQVKLLDFGLASEIRSTVMKRSSVVDPNATAGTLPYMAPEQFKGQPPGPASDQYALGILFYELVSGKLPFQVDNVQVLINAVCNEPHRPLAELTGKQNKILSKALDKNPGKRFSNAAKFVTALEKTRVPPSKAPIFAVLAALVMLGSLAWWYMNPQSPVPKTVNDRTVAELFGPVFKNPKWKGVKNVGLVEEFFGCPKQVYEEHELSLVRMSGSLNLQVRRDDDLKAISRNDQKSLEISNEKLGATSLKALSERSHDQAVLVGLCLGDRIYLKLISTRLGTLISKVSIPLVQASGSTQAPVQPARAYQEQSTRLKPPVAVSLSADLETTRQEAEQKRAKEAQEAAERERQQREREARTWTDPTTRMKFVKVPGGCFQMGSPESEKDRDSREGPVHEVCLDGFWMGKYEVTQGQWQSVMGENPSNFKKGDNYPVGLVFWDDTQKFFNKLNARGSGRFRLPTEAEWEYSCRAGTTTPFHFGETISADTQANYKGNYPYGGGPKGKNRQSTTPVGSFPSNAWGLHDMHGNVREWVQDKFDSKAYQKHSGRNPIYEGSGSNRVIRGGS